MEKREFVPTCPGWPGRAAMVFPEPTVFTAIAIEGK